MLCPIQENAAQHRGGAYEEWHATLRTTHGETYEERHARLRTTHGETYEERHAKFRTMHVETYEERHARLRTTHGVTKDRMRMTEKGRSRFDGQGGAECQQRPLVKKWRSISCCASHIESGAQCAWGPKACMRPDVCTELARTTSESQCRLVFRRHRRGWHGGDAHADDSDIT